MKITYKGDYALKALLELALHYETGVVTINELAKGADMPIKFLEQVLLELKKGGFVESRRGKEGGYLLAKPPSQIRLGEVVRFIDGSTKPIACTDKDYMGCSYTYNCVFREVWCQVDQAISGIIDNITFEDLAKRVGSRQEVLAYSI
jgi:Rrf2 family transcriptional regulator, cysteine metabolism repressor